MMLIVLEVHSEIVLACVLLERETHIAVDHLLKTILASQKEYIALFYSIKRINFMP